MDAGQFIASFLADFIVTVIAYGLGPILLLEFHKGPISSKKLKWFHIIYTIIVSFAFNIIRSLLGLSQVGSFTPAIIWGTVFYRINKKNFDQRAKAIPSDTYTQQEAQMKHFAVDESTGEVISETSVEEPEPVTLEYHPDFQLQGPPEEPKPEPPVESPAPPQKPSGKSYAPLCIVLSILLAASLAGNVAQSYMSANKLKEMTSRQDKLQAEVNSLQNRVSSLREEKDQLSEQLSNAQYSFNVQDEMVDMLAPEAFALETYIGFIYDGSQYCHNYNCPSFPFDNCVDDGFYAHNVEYCEWLGYPKHSECWD